MQENESGFEASVRTAKWVGRKVIRPGVIGAFKVGRWGVRNVVIPAANEIIQAEKSHAQEINELILRPVGRRMDRWLDRRVSVRRRTLLRAGLAIGATTFLAGKGVNPEGWGLPALPGADQAKKAESYLLEQFFPEMPSFRDQKTTSEPFLNKEANEEASKLGIKAGTFFELPFFEKQQEIYPQLTAISQAQELQPIFPPSVLEEKNRNLLYKLAESSNIPVNILAIIMTMESGGQADAESNQKDPNRDNRAQGLFGVMPKNFRDPHFAGQNPITDYDQMKDPLINGQFAAKIFKDEWEAAQRIHKGKSDAYILMRALMGYNGGRTQVLGEGNIDSPKIASESYNYGRQAVRFFLAAQIGESLKKKGYSEIQIASRFASPETDARSYAYQQVFNRWLQIPGETSGYKDLLLVEKALGQREIRSIPNLPQNYGQILFDTYNNYLARTISGIQVPQPTEIWRATGGGALYNQKINQDKEAWRALSTKKGDYIAVAPPTPEVTERPADPERVDRSVVLYSQLDPKWAENNPGWYQEATCGPTTIAMILSSFGLKADPAKVDIEFRKNGFRGNTDSSVDEPTTFRGNGTPGQEGYVVQWLRDKYNFEVKQIHDNRNPDATKQRFNFTEAKKLIDDGYLIAASGMVHWIDKYPKDKLPSGASHIFGISDVDVDNNKIKIFDPWKGKHEWHSVTPDQFNIFFYSYAIRPKVRAFKG